MRDLLRVPGFLLGLSQREGRGRLVRVAVLMLAGSAAAPVVSLGLRSVTNAAVAGDVRRAVWWGAAVGLLRVAFVALGQVALTPYFEVADLNQAAVDGRLVDLVTGAPGLEHLERPEYVDKLETLRNDAGQVFWGLMTLTSAVGLVLQVVFTGVVLATVQPLLLLLPLFALPPLLGGAWAQNHLDRVRERQAERFRLARHLLELTTKSEPAKEIRVFGLREELRRRQREVWAAMTDALWRAARVGALVRGSGSVLFALAYVGAVFVVVRGALDGTQTVGDVVLTISLAGQVNQQVAQALGLSYSLHALAKTVSRWRWLEEVTAFEPPPGGALPAPARIRDGISVEGVSFRYAGAERPALDGVSLWIPAGSVVAFVGENGAGKTTLAKLLCRFYDPTEGRILVDGVDLRRFDVAGWRSRLTAGFQDFVRFQLLAGHAVGVGDVPRLDDRSVVGAALARAASEDVLDSLPDGLDTQLGHVWGDGRELSGGQWQKLALGRAMMRDAPLVLLLDEPTSALDAEAEHALFAGYAERARAAAAETGAITLLVSHRFSTVRMADLIVVVEGGRIAELGTHDELVASGGAYAELFELQARAYR